MTTFLLIRHAKHDWLKRGLAGRLRGVHLSPEGQREAKALAENMKHIAVDAVYSSPLDRTRETAAFITSGSTHKIIYDAAFLEIDFGRWTAATFKSLEDDPEWKQWNANREEARAPGGEWMRDVRARALDQLAQLARQHSDSVVIIVTHGDVIRAVLTHCLGWTLDRIHELEIAPASISLLEWDDEPRVLSINHPGAESPIHLDQVTPHSRAA